VPLLLSRRSLILAAPAVLLARPVRSQILQFSGAPAVRSGGFPDATNTGVPAGTILSNISGFATSGAGQIVENTFVHGGIYVQHDNVIIRKCKIVAETNSWFVVCVASGNNVTVEDCEIYSTAGFSAGANKGVAGGHLIQRCNIHDVEQGYNPEPGSMFRDNYIHNLNNPANSGGPHYDGISAFGGGSNVMIYHNTVINQNIQTDCILFQNLYGPLSNFSVDNNRLIGGAFTIYCEDKSGANNIAGMSFTNNRLGRGYWGYLQETGNTIATWSNNVDDVTGTIIPARTNRR
jgi:hypothetical protein